MEQDLYDSMDWAGVEELVYSESSNPHGMLGSHLMKSGLLIQASIPATAEITVKILSTGEKYSMEMADDAGFFAVLVSRKSLVPYMLFVMYNNGTKGELRDPYAFGAQYTQEDLKKFEVGNHYSIYDKMGTHPMTINGVSGAYFSVWAPCAMRVSVVGDFNFWDGGRHQTRRAGEGEGSVFELFIPGLETGAIYKYEIKTKVGLPTLKADPYGNYSELRPNNASVIWDINQYQWNDREWMDKQAKTDTKGKPLNIYEVHLSSWIRKGIAKDESGKNVVGSEFYNYREIVVRLAEYVKEMGYTHVELMPVMGYPLDEFWGYQVIGYYCLTSRYGIPDDSMYSIDYMHGQDIGVILDWVPAHFPRDVYGMAASDGTCMYEHMDPRRGAHPHWGILIYNYGRLGMSNFLTANALFWTEKYHVDGIRMDAVAPMLYPDYGKNDEEWVPNLYRGNENLEAMEFLRHLSTIYRERGNGAVIIAEESMAQPKITGNPKDGGLGFDYKWNMGWMNDFTNYMHCDLFLRKNNYGELTFPMLYAYNENFALVFSYDEVAHGKGSMIDEMPEDILEKQAEGLRVAHALVIGHPGKKSLFMGQEYAQLREWDEGASLDWDPFEVPVHKNMWDYTKALNRLYPEHLALYETDYDPDGLEWISCSYQEESMVMFTHRSKDSGETLLLVCNFDNVDHEKFRAGVSFEGKYKEIFNSDAEEFDGTDKANGRVKTSKKVERDEKENSIEIHIASMSISIHACTSEPKVKKADTGKTGTGKMSAGETSVGKTSAGKTSIGKTSGKKVEVVKGEQAAQAVVPENARLVFKEIVPVKEKPGDLPKKKEKMKRLTTFKTELKQTPTKKIEAKQTSTKKAEPKQIFAKKTETKQISTKKTESRQISVKKTEPKQISTKKTEAKQILTKKTEPKQISTKKTRTKQISTKKTEPEQIPVAKAESHKLETSRKEPHKLEDKKTE